MSRTRIDLTGQRFGRLTALRDVGSKRNFRLWEFRCDCGSVIQRVAAHIRASKTQSCGCLANELTSQRKKLDLVGHRAGRLVGIACLGPNKFGQLTWLCRCDCGNETKLAASALKRAAVKSCGCLQREAAAEFQRRRALPKDAKRQSVLRNRANQRARRKSDPTLAMRSRLSRLMAHALRGAGVLKNSPTLEMLGYTADDLRRHIEKQLTDGMSWDNRSEWQLDHIIPVSTARTKDDVIALNQLSNLRPMWAKENNRKKDQRLHLL